MSRTKIIVLLLSPLVLAGLLFVVFSTIDPATVNPIGILGIFTLIYLFFLAVFFVLFHFGVEWTSRVLLKQKGSMMKKEISIGARKAYYIASVLAFAPVVFLAMGSFAQLRWTDVLLVSVLMTITIFYIVKRG